MVNNYCLDIPYHGKCGNFRASFRRCMCPPFKKKSKRYGKLVRNVRSLSVPNFPFIFVVK